MKRAQIGSGPFIDENRRLRKCGKRFFKLSEASLKLRVIREKGAQPPSKSRNAKERRVSDEAHHLVRSVGFFDRLHCRL